MISDTGGKYVPPGDDSSDEDLEGSLPQNVTQMMKQYGKNGIVVSGVVTWIQVNKNMAANGIWKQVAEQNWNDEEITEAKNALAAAGGEKLVQLAPGMGVNRKSVPGRKVKEIKDIIDGITALEECNSMPLVLASSGQMRRCPQSLGSVGPNANMGDLTTKVVALEDTLKKFMESSKQQIESLTETLKKKPEQRFDPSVHIGTPSKKRKTVDPEEKGAENIPDSEAPIIGNPTYANIAGIQPIGKSNHLNQQNQMLSNIFKNIIDKSKNDSSKETKKPTGRNVFHGKARSSAEESANETFLAADVALVASGVAKDAKPEQLKEFLAAKGIEVIQVECLTKKQLLDDNVVRSQTMKVTVKAAHHEKAMNPDVWPLRVGVRYFRAPRRQNTEGSDWQSQSNQSGGNLSENQRGERSKQQGWQRQDGNRTPFRQRNGGFDKNQSQFQPFSPLAVKNMFDVLGNMGLISHP